MIFVETHLNYINIYTYNFNKLFSKMRIDYDDVGYNDFVEYHKYKQQLLMSLTQSIFFM